jgi:hypothetical protein
MGTDWDLDPTGALCPFMPRRNGHGTATVPARWPRFPIGPHGPAIAPPLGRLVSQKYGSFFNTEKQLAKGSLLFSFF